MAVAHASPAGRSTRAKDSSSTTARHLQLQEEYWRVLKLHHALLLDFRCFPPTHVSTGISPSLSVSLRLSALGRRRCYGSSLFPELYNDSASPVPTSNGERFVVSVGRSEEWWTVVRCVGSADAWDLQMRGWRRIPCQWWEGECRMYDLRILLDVNSPASSVWGGIPTLYLRIASSVVQACVEVEGTCSGGLWSKSTSSFAIGRRRR